MKNFIEAAQYAFAALGGALGAVMGGFDGFLYALVVFVVVDYASPAASAASRHDQDAGAVGIGRPAGTVRAKSIRFCGHMGGTGREAEAAGESTMGQPTREETAEGSVAGTAPAAHWEAGRYPQAAALLKTLAWGIIIHQAVPLLPAAVADGSAGTMACAVSQAQEAPAMWTVWHHSPTTGNITLRKPRQG